MNEKRKMDLDSVLGRALESERLLAASRISLIRMLVVALWLLVYVGYTLFVSSQLAVLLYPMAAYAVASVGIFLACRYSSRFLKNSWYMLPLVDIPAIFTIHFFAIDVMPWPAGITVGFGAVGGVLVVVVAQLSMQIRNVVVTAVMSALLVMVMQYYIGELRSWPSTLVAFAAITSVTIYLPGRIRYLIECAVKSIFARERMEKEMELARGIQKSLLPKAHTSGVPVYGLNIPFHEVSGDFYDYILLEDGRIYFSLGDVSGKGMDAAMVMAKVCSLFQCLGKTVHSPSCLLSMINDELMENMHKGMFVTMVAGLYDPQGKNILLANAGHLPGILSGESGEVGRFQATAPPLGVVEDIEVQEIEVRPGGSTLYLFTDGLAEIRDREGNEHGINGVFEAIMSCRGVPVHERAQAIVDTVLNNGQDKNDDVTLLLVEARAA